MKVYNIDDIETVCAGNKCDDKNQKNDLTIIYESIHTKIQEKDNDGLTEDLLRLHRHLKDSNKVTKNVIKKVLGLPLTQGGKRRKRSTKRKSKKTKKSKPTKKSKKSKTNRKRH